MTEIKITLPEDKKLKCPICNRLNNHLYGDCCDHVDRLTIKGIVIFKNSYKQ